MKKNELFELAERLHMEPLMVATDVRECYGETVIVNEYQTGFQLEAEELVPEIERLMGPADADKAVTPVRMVAGTKFYRYQLFAPSNWFEREED